METTVPSGRSASTAAACPGDSCNGVSMLTVPDAANASSGWNRRTPLNATNASTAHRQTETLLDIGGALPSGPWRTLGSRVTQRRRLSRCAGSADSLKSADRCVLTRGTECSFRSVRTNDGGRSTCAVQSPPTGLSASSFSTSASDGSDAWAPSAQQARPPTALANRPTVGQSQRWAIPQATPAANASPAPVGSTTSTLEGRDVDPFGFGDDQAAACAARHKRRPQCRAAHAVLQRGRGVADGPGACHLQHVGFVADDGVVAEGHVERIGQSSVRQGGQGTEEARRRHGVRRQIEQEAP